jgi:hypothetical protein
LETFVAVRNEIASNLRSEGDDESADRVAKLKKPAISAWIVNQLVRTHQLDVQRLLRAGENLERAQRDLLAGSVTEFEEARKEEAGAVKLLINKAKEVAPKASAAILDRVTQTLRAATSENARNMIKAGQLTEDLEPPGFDAFSVAAAGAKPKGKNKGTDSKRRQALQQQLQEATAANKQQAQEASALDRLANEAELEAKRARQRADAARKKANAGAEKLARVTAELAALD